MSIFDTFTTALGGSGTTAGKFAALALDLVQGGSHGGLEGLLERFRQHGLHEQVGSWVGTGRNLPITADDIQRVLGSAQVSDLAQRAGIDAGAASQELAAILPQLVDKLTPAGQLPQGDVMEQAFAALKAKIGMI